MNDQMKKQIEFFLNAYNCNSITVGPELYKNIQLSEYFNVFEYSPNEPPIGPIIKFGSLKNVDNYCECWFDPNMPDGEYKVNYE